MSFGKTKLFLIILTILLSRLNISFAREVPFTQDDGDRLIRLDTKVDEGLKALNQRIDDTNKRTDDLRKELKENINDLKTFMLWGFGILFGGMGILIGFVIWDRRTAGLVPKGQKYY